MIYSPWYWTIVLEDLFCLSYVMVVHIGDNYSKLSWSYNKFVDNIKYTSSLDHYGVLNSTIDFKYI
jgi:hypothetical protein